MNTEREREEFYKHKSLVVVNEKKLPGCAGGWCHVCHLICSKERVKSYLRHDNQSKAVYCKYFDTNIYIYIYIIRKRYYSIVLILY